MRRSSLISSWHSIPVKTDLERIQLPRNRQKAILKDRGLEFIFIVLPFIHIIDRDSVMDFCQLRIAVNCVHDFKWIDVRHSLFATAVYIDS